MLSDPSLHSAGSCKNIRSAGYCAKDGTCEPLENFSFVSVCLFPEEEEAARCRQAGHQWDSILFSGGDYGARGATHNPRDQLWAPTLQLSTKPLHPRLPQLHLTGTTSSNATLSLHGEVGLQ